MWPTQLVLVLAALTVIGTALRSGVGVGAHRTVGAVLGALWIWMGVVHHWIHFAAINPAAWGFGGLFVFQGVLFLALAARREPMRYRPGWDTYGIVGALFVAYALIVYPLLGGALGHVYPAQPTFGLPWPTTIFTMGVLLWAADRVPPAVLVILVLWSLVGMNAAWLFGVVEDFALPVAALGGAGLVLARNRRLAARSSA